LQSRHTSDAACIHLWVSTDIERECVSRERERERETVTEREREREKERETETETETRLHIGGIAGGFREPLVALGIVAVPFQTPS
jgi:hypothetical protein